MSTYVNKSITGVQTRFNKRSQPALIQDVPQIVTRNSRARNSVAEMENLSSSTNKAATNSRLWRSRRTEEHLSTSVQPKEQISNKQDRNGKFQDDVASSNGENPLSEEGMSNSELYRLKNWNDVKNVAVTEANSVEDSDSYKEKSRTGKHLRTLVNRLAPTPGFVDKNSLPTDLQSRRRVRRLASLNAAAKVNVFFEPSSPLAGRSLSDIMQHSKKIQGGEGEGADQIADGKENSLTKSKGKSKLDTVSPNGASYLESPNLLYESVHASLGCAEGTNNDDIPISQILKRGQGSSEDEAQTKRIKLDQNGQYTTIIGDRRFLKGKEMIDVGLQVEVPKGNGSSNALDLSKTCCRCRSSKVIDIPIQSYVSTYSNGTLVSIPITKTHRLTPQVPDKPSPELAQGDLACRSKRIAGLNSRAMLNAILTQERKSPSLQSAARQRKLPTKKGFYEHGLNNTVPSTLKIPKINFAATSTSNFSAFGRGKAYGSHLGKTGACGSVWQKSAVLSHDGPKRTNGWFFLDPPIIKTYYYSDLAVTRKYYSGIKRNNETIYVRDSVLLKSGPRRKDLPFVARVSGFWEEMEGPYAGEMMMSVLWYYRPEQTEIGKQPHIHGENEILASRHKDDNSVACIVDKCYVLSYPEYCRYRAAIKRSQDFRIPSTNPVPPAEATGSWEKAPLSANPKLVFFCRQIYDYRMGRIMKNPVIYNPS